MPGYKIISADDHVFEPPDLWTDRTEHRFRDRAPLVVREGDGDWWYCDNHRITGMAGGAQVGVRFGHADELTLTTTVDNVRLGAYIPEEHIKDMDNRWRGCKHNLSHRWPSALQRAR